MLWFILAFVAVAVSIVVMTKRPLWGTLPSTMCAMTIGLKAGALFRAGRWPTFVEGLILVGLTGLSYIVLRRKWRTWEEARRAKIRELRELLRKLQVLAQLAQELQQDK